MGFDGSQAVVDPMCGSGTIPLEAAEIAAGLVPGRDRSFAFEAMKGGARPRRRPTGVGFRARFHGFDRDQGAIRGAVENAERAGCRRLCRFDCQPLSELQPPEGPPGIVLTNPPYGARIGNRKPLFRALFGSLGKVLSERFKGWRVGSSPATTGWRKAGPAA
jgi:putative N6-adenine-specific DNA methylase